MPIVFVWMLVLEFGHLPVVIWKKHTSLSDTGLHYTQWHLFRYTYNPFFSYCFVISSWMLTLPPERGITKCQRGSCRKSATVLLTKQNCSMLSRHPLPQSLFVLHTGGCTNGVVLDKLSTALFLPHSSDKDDRDHLWGLRKAGQEAEQGAGAPGARAPAEEAQRWQAGQEVPHQQPQTQPLP